MFSFTDCKKWLTEIIGCTFVACSAQVISADTLPTSLKALLLLISARHDKFLSILDTT